MATAIHRIRVMISAPSDMGAERTLCSQIIADVNSMVEDAFGVTLRMIDWRSDIVPGVGADPQQVVNDQTRDYEVYVGLFGTRFGTPTPRAGSGTEDEFNLAHSRFRADSRSVRILLYFRTGLSRENVHEVDLEQLQKVRQRFTVMDASLPLDVETARAAKQELSALLTCRFKEPTLVPVPP